MAGLENSTSLPISRRVMLAGAAVIVAVPLQNVAAQALGGDGRSAALPTASADAAHGISPRMEDLHWRWSAFVRRYQDLEDENCEDHAIWERLDWEYDALMHTIAATPVRTIGDVTFKLEVALHNATAQSDTYLFRGILEDLRTLAA